MNPLYKRFPNLPLQALEFFRIPNKTDGKFKTVLDFAIHISQKNVDQNWPHLGKLVKVLDRLHEFGLLHHWGQPLGSAYSAMYITAMDGDEIKAIKHNLNYITYGFPVIYEELRSSVFPIINSESGMGTGFKCGHNTIVTAAHCITGADKVEIEGLKAEHYEGAEVAIHKNDVFDLAAIRFKRDLAPEQHRPLKLSIGNVLDQVIVMGYPNVPSFHSFLAVEKATISSRFTVSRGQISAKEPDIFSKIPLLLVSAQVRGGFSGGPAVNQYGDAVGIILRSPDFQKGSESQAIAQQYDDVGYGIAVPAETLVDFFEKCGERSEEIEFCLPKDIGLI